MKNPAREFFLDESMHCNRCDGFARAARRAQTAARAVRPHACRRSCAINTHRSSERVARTASRSTHDAVGGRAPRRRCGDFRARIFFRNRRANRREALTKNVRRGRRDVRKKIGDAMCDAASNRARNRCDEREFEEALCALGAFGAKKSKRICV